MSNNPNVITWSLAPQRLELASDEVHVWRASLDCEASVLSRLHALLSPDERSRALRLFFEADRSHFVTARGILREILGRYLELSAADIQFTYGVHDKPGLEQEHPGSPLRFNLSHSHGIVVYAFARGRELGIDIEQIRPSFAGEEIAERYFSAHELAELRALPPESRAKGFFLCWTRKEAYVKAHGGGLQIPLDSFDVSLTPGHPETLWSTDSSRWTLRSFEPAPGYAAAIVGEGSNWRRRFLEWKP